MLYCAPVNHHRKNTMRSAPQTPQSILQTMFDRGYFVATMPLQPKARDFAKRFNDYLDKMGGDWPVYKVSPRMMSWMLPKVEGDHLMVLKKTGMAQTYLVRQYKDADII